MKQSFAWWCFQSPQPEQFLRATASIGFQGVELLEPELFPLARRCGLTIATHRAHTTLERGLNDRAEHARIEGEILENLRLAERWQIPVLICFSGNRQLASWETEAQITAEGLRRVVRAAEAAGVTLALELLNSKLDHPNYAADHTAWGLRVCELLASPRVKLLFDAYHMQVMEGDLIRTIQQHHAQIGHYHVAGNPGRHEPDDTQEINYTAVARAIRATGFDGFVGQEFIPTVDSLLSLKAAFGVFDADPSTQA